RRIRRIVSPTKAAPIAITTHIPEGIESLAGPLLKRIAVKLTAFIDAWQRIPGHTAPLRQAMTPSHSPTGTTEITCAGSRCDAQKNSELTVIAASGVHRSNNLRCT